MELLTESRILFMKMLKIRGRKMYLLEIPDLNESVQKYERKSSIGKMATE
jgi:hypothetical protein